MRGFGFAARPLRAAFVAALLGTVMAAGMASPAAACIAQYLGRDAEADVIFSGTAVRLNEVDDGIVFEWTFVVDSVEKGSIGERATVWSWRGDSCRAELDLGTRYRVLATTSWFPPRLEVSGAGGTREIEPLLNPPPVEGVFQTSDWFLPVAMLSFAVAIGLASSLIIRRRRLATAHQ